MFKWKLDDEINLCLVHQRFAPRYVQLAAENKAYLSQWLAWPAVCSTEEDFRQFVAGSLHKYADGVAMNCAIEYRGEIIGNVGFNSINPTLQVAEIGYWMAESCQGKGIMTRCCRHLIDYAFSELAMEKVQISAAEDNTPSRAVCERLGMTLEGIITRKEKVGDRILNHAVYGFYRSQSSSGSLS